MIACYCCLSYAIEGEIVNWGVKQCLIITWPKDSSGCVFFFFFFELSGCVFWFDRTVYFLDNYVELTSLDLCTWRLNPICCISWFYYYSLGKIISDHHDCNVWSVACTRIENYIRSSLHTIFIQASCQMVQAYDFLWHISILYKIGCFALLGCAKL